jgi:small-conductance mechanosensitive channel
MQGLLPGANETRAFLEQFTSTEGRLGISAALVVVALTVAWFLLPRLISGVDRTLSERLFGGRLARVAELTGRYVPTTLSGVILRSVQVGVLLVTVTSILLVWGLASVVTDAVAYVTNQIPLIGQFVSSALLLLAAYVGSRILADSVTNVSQQTEWMTEHQQEIVLRVSQLALFTVAGLLLLTIWQADLGGLLVGAGFLGIVVGFAARQTLGSLIAGFVLMFSRPFTIGDWVQIGDQEGIVTDITIFNTRLENFDGEFVIIPNDRVSDRAVTNRSEKGLLRVRVDVGIDYDTDPEHAREVATETIRDLNEVMDGPPPQVFPKSFGDSAVVLEMRFWIDHPTPPRKWRATAQVIQSVKETFESEGIKIPYPQRELSGRAETGGFRVHETASGSRTDGHDGHPDAETRPEQK